MIAALLFSTLPSTTSQVAKLQVLGRNGGIGILASSLLKHLLNQAAISVQKFMMKLPLSNTPCGSQ